MGVRVQSKVSIVVPVYNKIEYIDMMLESVYNQIWDKIELILVNDGATDGTRKRLAVWKPKFQARGYEVVIIDQENKGIPSAVKTGLLHASGEYVCLVDCDDTIKPDYVSTMAGWLEDHSEDEWAVCSFNKFLVEGNDIKILSTVNVSSIPCQPDMMEKYLSAKYITAVWIYMVRTSYLRECKVTERYITNIRSTQEPGFLFPLIIGGGRLKVINKALYNHNFYPLRTSAYQTASYAVAFQDNYRDIVVKTIENLDVCSSLKKKWCIMAEFAHKATLIQSIKKLNDGLRYLPGLAVDACSLIQTHFDPDPGITQEHIMENNYDILSTAISDCILDVKPNTPPNEMGSIIGYGALGKSGRKLIPELVNTPLEPNQLWDISANPGDMVCGIPVSLPKFENLTSSEVFLVFPYAPDVRATVTDALKHYSIEHILFTSDIYQYLSVIKYSQFYTASRFVV